MTPAKPPKKAPARARRKGSRRPPVAPVAETAQTEEQPLRGLAATALQEATLPSDELVLGEPVDLVVLSCKPKAILCRVLGSERELTLRASVRDAVPGEILDVLPTGLATRAGRRSLTGRVQSSRADAAALGLTPLALREWGEWDPCEEYWGEEGEPIADWAKPIIARGKRPMFEFEQVIPGADPDDFDSDPIVAAHDLAAAGARREARNLLMDLLAADLRCLDAHAHLGNLEFERRPGLAIRHYSIGVSLGMLTLGPRFDGVLPWGLLDNRPFLRCLHGLALCTWRLGDMSQAEAIFHSMLWLNPSDNQGARFNLAAVRAGRTWEEMEDEYD